MAQLQRESFSCSVCLDPLKDPVTIPCGHSYCKTCISSVWDVEKKDVYSCPQCRHKFKPRPVLMKNLVLEKLVRQMKKSRVQDDPGDPADEDVSCDVCTERKVKAHKSCLTCVASYCEEHLQPHHESSAFKRHRLVDPSRNLQENICSRHDELMKMFCRTDQQCICILCSMEEHKGHQTVSAAAERTEKQKELKKSRANINKNIQDREKDLQLLEEQEETINSSAYKAVEHSHQMMNELINVINRRNSELEEKVLSKHQTEVSVVRELQEKLHLEISELKKRDTDLQQISNTEDHIQFVLSYSSLSALSVSTHSPISHTHPQSDFQELTEHLHTILMEDWTKVCETVKRVKGLQPPRPMSREGFIQYSKELTLDPNTAHTRLKLLDANRKVTFMRDDQHHPPHKDRFTRCTQVLSRESLTGPSYWEVEFEVGKGGIGVGVAYESISRDWGGRDCVFGYNHKSWMLQCAQHTCMFYHGNVSTEVPGSCSSRVGVYVDPREGALTFYSVGDTMTLLHKVKTTFTEPLHMGLSLNHEGDSAEVYSG